MNRRAPRRPGLQTEIAAAVSLVNGPRDKASRQAIRLSPVE